MQARITGTQTKEDTMAKSRKGIWVIEYTEDEYYCFCSKECAEDNTKSLLLGIPKREKCERCGKDLW